MPSIEVNEVTLDSGQVVLEATCPFDSTIKPRLPKKVVKEVILSTDSDADDAKSLIGILEEQIDT
jgi:hypothetical protein